MSRAPSLSKPTIFSHITLCCSKYSDIIFMTSIPFDVVYSSSLIMLSRANVNNWQYLEMSLDLLHCKVEHDEFLIFDIRCSPIWFDISSNRAFTLSFDKDISWFSYWLLTLKILWQLWLDKVLREFLLFVWLF